MLTTTYEISNNCEQGSIFNINIDFYVCSTDTQNDARCLRGAYTSLPEILKRRCNNRALLIISYSAIVCHRNWAKIEYQTLGLLLSDSTQLEARQGRATPTLHSRTSSECNESTIQCQCNYRFHSMNGYCFLHRLITVILKKLSKFPVWNLKPSISHWVIMFWPLLNEAQEEPGSS